MMLSRRQEIAGFSCFSLGMIARFKVQGIRLRRVRKR
jgi:hypothetical protein